MNVVLQCKVIGPYNYDRILHNKKKYVKRQDAFDFEDNIFCNSLNTLKVKYLACSALGDLHTYTKHI